MCYRDNNFIIIDFRKSERFLRQSNLAIAYMLIKLVSREEFEIASFVYCISEAELRSLKKENFYIVILLLYNIFLCIVFLVFLIIIFFLRIILLIKILVFVDFVIIDASLLLLRQILRTKKLNLIIVVLKETKERSRNEHICEI